jgi:hypothetical protein
MVEELKSGTSINNLLPSEQDITTNLGISRAQEETTTCKSGALIQDGGNSSSMINQEKLSETSTTKIEYLIPLHKIKRDKQLESGRSMVEPIKNGMFFT